MTRFRRIIEIEERWKSCFFHDYLITSTTIRRLIESHANGWIEILFFVEENFHVLRLRGRLNFGFEGSLWLYNDSKFMRTVYKYFLSNFTFLRFTIFTIDVLYHFLFFFFWTFRRNCFKIFSYRKYARLRVTVRELIELCKYFLSNRRMAGMFRFSCERGARSTCKLCFFFFRSLMINAKLNFLIDWSV